MGDARTENRRLWDEWSDDFQALWNADTADGDLPPAPCPFTADAPGGSQPEILPSVEGLDVVELGCGGGQASVGTADEGADRVVGVDVSSGQLAHARKLRDLYGVDARFVEGDVTHLPLAADAFDVAFSGWVLQMVGDLETCLTEARRVLRDDGVLVFDVPHPFYELFDPASEALERSYHATGRREITIDEDYDADMVVFDRKVGDYHRALVDAGFDVERVLEPGSDDPDDYDDDPLESNRPELMATVPRSLRFWAVAN
ncbi:class I SAM-dependent methyltransferase [Halomicrobium salinisoli]|uniref:class I SAM-dependent methyltransferase n=1 Tax=Halomicrobium salinisoli TaxID=2878391 RepID=UPI001CEFEB8A|nr:class I SAM-dependent methyltransferase [Halomicrobium salinisoli]